MWKLIKYLFYKSYKFYKYEMGDKSPEFMGVLVVGGILIFLLMSILNFTSTFDFFNKKTWALFSVLYLGFWIYIFYRKGKWKEIIKEFENESKKARKRGRILSILAVILSITLFIISLFFI